MAEWEAPAKLNLDLRVGARDARGLHPLRSIVLAVEWCETVQVDEGDEDTLEVEGAELPSGADNLVWKAVDALDLSSRPRLHIRLQKVIPVAAGLGGGSSDAAATLEAVAELTGASRERVESAAARVGADVPFFLSGGAALMEGYGERLTPIPAPEGYAVGVVVPPFELFTAAVYARWDEMGDPVGEEISAHLLPPSLRLHGDMRNDLTPAAVSLLPELGDWMEELESLWSRPVFMSGSGPGCFSYFLDEEEAAAGVEEVVPTRGGMGAGPRRRGVSRSG